MGIDISLRPARHIPRIPDEEVRQIYPRMRWRILESTFIGYAVFYFVRNNLPVVSREMGQALHYSKDQIGNMLAVTAICYGVGKFVMGPWSDRSNPRYFMPLGLVLTAICNFAFGAVSSYPVHLLLWGLNGAVQGMGWAPCGRSMGHWFSIRERGTVFGFWYIAHNVGGGLTGLLVAYTTTLLGWRSAFYVPGVLAVLCAIYLLVRLRDTPQSVGLPPIEEYRNDYPPQSAEDSEKELGTRRLLVDYILGNRWLWLFAMANFFIYIARYSLLDWGPTYLKEARHATIGEGGISTAMLEFAGIFSTIFMGWLSDKLGGRRGMVSLICMVPVCLGFIGIIHVGRLSLDLALFAVIGFFIYPPLMLLDVTALDFSSKKAVGTAAGFIGLLGYMGRMMEGKGIGIIAEHYGWTAALYSVACCCVCAIILLAFTWRLSPHNAKPIAEEVLEVSA